MQKLSDKTILDWIEDCFPGLLDGETEVNGGDLVEQLTDLLERRKRAAKGESK